jgi:hypothetical protein
MVQVASRTCFRLVSFLAYFSTLSQVAPKRPLSFNDLHGVVTQKIGKRTVNIYGK